MNRHAEAYEARAAKPAGKWSPSPLGRGDRGEGTPYHIARAKRVPYPSPRSRLKTRSCQPRLRPWKGHVTEPRVKTWVAANQDPGPGRAAQKKVPKWR